MRKINCKKKNRLDRGSVNILRNCRPYVLSARQHSALNGYVGDTYRWFLLYEEAGKILKFGCIGKRVRNLALAYKIAEFP